jgi:hypothetical protein
MQNFINKQIEKKKEYDEFKSFIKDIEDDDNLQLKNTNEIDLSNQVKEQTKKKKEYFIEKHEESKKQQQIVDNQIKDTTDLVNSLKSFLYQLTDDKENGSKIALEVLDNNELFFQELEEKLKEKNIKINFKDIFNSQSIINWEIFNKLTNEDFIKMGFNKGCIIILSSLQNNK